LISPDDVFHAAQTLEKINLPMRCVELIDQACLCFYFLDERVKVDG